MPNDDGSERGLAAWIRRWWRPLIAETVATALLVSLGVASLLPVGGKEPPLTHAAFAFGIVVLANVEAFGPTSGAHMNPSVTLAALLDGRIGPVAAAAYVVAQSFGATIGFGLLMALCPDAFAAGGHVGGNAPGSVGAAAAAGVEALLTAVLALLCCAAWAAAERGARDPALSIKLGLTVAGLVYAGGVMSSASLNPARSLGPALLVGFRSDHWVYWAGPLGGAALGALLHRYVLRPPRAAASRSEELPLNDKGDR